MPSSTSTRNIKNPESICGKFMQKKMPAETIRKQSNQEKYTSATLQQYQLLWTNACYPLLVCKNQFSKSVQISDLGNGDCGLVDVGSSLFLCMVLAQVVLTVKASEAPFHSPGLVLVVVAHRPTTDPNVLVTLVGNAASHIAMETWCTFADRFKGILNTQL